MGQDGREDVGSVSAGGDVVGFGVIPSGRRVGSEGSPPHVRFRSRFRGSLAPYPPPARDDTRSLRRGIVERSSIRVSSLARYTSSE